MIINPKSYYDILAFGLAGTENFQSYVDTFFTRKYGNPQLDGFSWDDDIQASFGFEGIEAETGIATMATIVDYDAKGQTKSFKSVKVSSGDIPRMRHEYAIDEKVIREKTIMAQRFNKIDANTQNVINKLLFNSVDRLLAGNLARLTHQRHQIISTGMYTLTEENNKGGLRGLTLDFGVPTANKKACGGFEGYGVKAAWSDDSADPISDLLGMVNYAEENGLEFGHFEMSKKKYRQFINHVNVKKTVMQTLYPTADASALGNILGYDKSVSGVLVAAGLPEIKIIDSLVAVDVWDEDEHTMVNKNIRPFDEGVVVLVPNGSLGTIKAVSPIMLDDPSVRQAAFDGGRTVIIQHFDSDTKTQRIESELTALVVPTKVKSFIYLDTESAAA